MADKHRLENFEFKRVAKSQLLATFKTKSLKALVLHLKRDSKNTFNWSIAKLQRAAGLTPAVFGSYALPSNSYFRAVILENRNRLPELSEAIFKVLQKTTKGSAKNLVTAEFNAQQQGYIGCCGATFITLDLPEGFDEKVRGLRWAPKKAVVERMDSRFRKHKLDRGNGDHLVLSPVQASFFRDVFRDQLGFHETNFGAFGSVFFRDNPCPSWKRRKWQSPDHELTGQERVYVPWNWEKAREADGVFEKKYGHQIPSPYNPQRSGPPCEIISGFAYTEAFDNLPKSGRPAIQLIVLRNKGPKNGPKNQISAYYDAAIKAGFVPLTPSGDPYLNNVYKNETHWLMPMARVNPDYDEDL